MTASHDAAPRALWVSDRFVQFVDIVFGVVVAQGFVRYADLIMRPSVSCFAFWGLGGVYVVTTLSWVGYHRSMNRYPYETTTRKAWVRMGCDFLIVALYARLLFSIEELRGGAQTTRLDNYIFGYLAIFLLYLASGVARMWEKNDRSASKSKPILACVGSYSFLLVAYGILAHKFGVYLSVNWLFLLACPLLYTGYRLWRHPYYETSC
jgi:hypothetical protein